MWDEEDRISPAQLVTLWCVLCLGLPQDYGSTGVGWKSRPHRSVQDRDPRIFESSAGEFSWNLGRGGLVRPPPWRVESLFPLFLVQLERMREADRRLGKAMQQNRAPNVQSSPPSGEHAAVQKRGRVGASKNTLRSGKASSAGVFESERRALLLLLRFPSLVVIVLFFFLFFLPDRHWHWALMACRVPVC